MEKIKTTALLIEIEIFVLPISLLIKFRTKN